VARRGRHSRSTNDPFSTANLDDLLRFDEVVPLGPEFPPSPTRKADTWVAKAALTAFILSAVVYTLLHVFNFAPPYPLIAAVCAGIVLVRHGVKRVAEPSWLRARDVVKASGPRRRIAPGGWYAGGDGMLAAVRRWDRRLDWGTGAPDRFDHVVADRLADLADERLRQRHAITRASDPARARALLGEKAWAMMAGQAVQIPTPREVAAVLDRIASL
jgi:hypothetical protein